MTILRQWILCLFILTSFQALGQLNPYKYRLGGGMGYSNYYGDLSPYRINDAFDFEALLRNFEFNPNYIQQYSYALSLERRLSAGVGLMLHAGQYDISMSDRYLDKDNQLQTDLPNFNRALNFNTRIQDLGISLVFRADNGKILKQNAFMAPYLTLGVGWLDFNTKGDLLNDEGEIYDYRRPNLINNYQFETPLADLNTELDEGYATNAYYAGLGLGIRFRLGKKLELFVQSDFRITTTDYLDDVSGPYRENYDTEFQRYAAMPGSIVSRSEQEWRGDPNLGNDWYIFHQAGLKFSFVPAKEAFRASRVSPDYGSIVPQVGIEKKDPVPATNPEPDSTSSGGSPQYFTFIQINNGLNDTRRLERSMKIIGLQLGRLETSQQIAQSELFISTLNEKIDSLNLVESNRSQLQDASNPESEENYSELRQKLIQQRDSSYQSLDKLKTKVSEENQRIDSLNAISLPLYDNLNPRDSLSVLKGLEQLPDAILKGINQNNSWQPLNNPNESPLERQQPSNNSGSENFIPLQSFDSAPREESTRYIYQNPTQTYDNRERVYYPYPAADNLNRNNYTPAQPTNPTNYFVPQEQTRFAPVFIPQNRRQSSGQRGDDRALMPTADSTASESTLRSFDGIGWTAGRGKYSYIPGTFPALDFDRESISYPMLNGKADSVTSGFSRVDTVMVEKEKLIGLNNSKTEVYFDLNKSVLSEDQKEKLVPMVNLLQENPDFSIILSGFADNTGNVNYNLSLVEQRVQHVKSVLMEQYSIAENRIRLVPGGLLVRGNNRTAKPRDRKVELLVMDENGNMIKK